jgi:hypothetical protein
MERPPGRGAALSETLQAAKLEFSEYGPNRLRLQRQAVALHRLGPRPLAEFIAEIIARHPELQARVDAYLRLTPEMLSVVGAERFPPTIFEVQP